MFGMFWSLFLEESEKSPRVSPEGEHPSDDPGEWFVGGVGGRKRYWVSLSPLLTGLPVHCIWLFLALSDPIMPT